MKDLQFFVLSNAAVPKKSAKGQRNSSLYNGEVSAHNARNASLSIGTSSVLGELKKPNSLIDSRKSNIGKLIEKNLDLMNKGSELLSLKSSYSKFEEKLEYNRAMLSDLEKEIKGKKEILKEIIHIRRSFLISLLKQGLDSGFPTCLPLLNFINLLMF